jgi:formate hydrogenlyase transcriptional activator
MESISKSCFPSRKNSESVDAYLDLPARLTTDFWREHLHLYPPRWSHEMNAPERIPRFDGPLEATNRSGLLLEINNAIVSHLDLAPLLKSISECLRRELPHDFAGLAIYDAEIKQLRVHGLDFLAGERFFSVGQIVPIEGTPAGLAFTSGKPVLRARPDTNEFPAEVMKQAMLIGVKSGCVVPLICHGKTLGTLAVASFREAAYSEADAELLNQIAGQVAIAVQNALNFDQLRVAEREVTRERDRSKLLLEVNNAVVSHLSLKELLKSMSASLHKVVRHDAAFLTLLDSTGKQLRVHAFDLQNPQKGPFEEGIFISLEDTPEGEAVRLRRAVLIARQAELARFSPLTMHKAFELGIKSGCAVPLMVHSRTLGSLSMVSFQEAAFDEDDARLLEQCSSQVAIAVENALNFENARQAEREVRKERDRSQLLLDVNNALVSHLDLHALVKIISSNLQQVLQHDFVGLALYETHSGKLIARARDSSADAIVPFDPEGTTSGLAFETGRPVYLPRPDRERFPSAVTEEFFQRGLKTFYSVPVTVHGRKLGVLTLASVREDALSEDDRELVQQITNQVALAAANALAVRDLEDLRDKLAQEKLYLEDEIRTGLNFDEIIGQSPALRYVLQMVDTVASSDSTVLLLGETGTGKELIARAVHEHSRRKARTFVKLNCAAIPTGLLESELFGHEKGAFTGAIAQKIGRLELADQGTLFLDEVGDIPVEIQPKLLRALQEREFERLGSTHTKKVNVRLVAATNRDLEKMIAAREFRSDLYYRLNVFPIRIPPLRERPDDIPLLVRYFAEKFSRQMQKSIESVPATAMAKLQAWHWPGNIRELENLIERSVILSNGSALQVPLAELDQPRTNGGPRTPPTTLEGTEREHIIKMLRETRGVLAGPNGAASRLGLKRTTLQYKMKKLGITRDHWWPAASP